MDDGLDRGLTDEEVADRRASGLTNHVDEAHSRTVEEIVRNNTVTRFNAILGGLLLVIVVVGPFRDALFGVVLVANTGIGIVQELRAKRALDRLALVTAPAAVVIRGGERRSIRTGDVVRDEHIVLAAGDEVIADGVVIESLGLEVDESLLSGEAEPVAKPVGAQVLSGSLVVAGAGRYQATAVGDSSYAARLTAAGKTFDPVRSELRSGIDVILQIVSWAIAPVGLLLVTSQLASHDGLAEALRSSVAGIGAMVPEGLVLLTSVAFAVGAVRVGRRRVLIQELAALEGLARVDTVCIDKTGTLTEPELELAGVEPVGSLSEAEVRARLSFIAADDHAPNATMRAITRAQPAEVPVLHVTSRVVFSSSRKWSALTTSAGETWVLGAADVLLDRGSTVRHRADELSRSGFRVVLLARAGAAPSPDDPVDPVGAEPVGLALFEERVRVDAADTVSYFNAEGVTLRVLSGDHPSTVEAVAHRVGLEGQALDARDLPVDDQQLAAMVEETTIIGRVQPHQKQRVVEALRHRGHVVAMVGDGVNDILALKAADIGVAMGGGTAATRAVARVILVDNRFAAMPDVVAEGRRVIANVERVANLFVTKTVYAVILAIAIGVARVPFPFLPRQLTIVSSCTIGIPAFFLALAPSARRARAGFVGRVVRFAVPAGTVAAAASLVSYHLARAYPRVSLEQARTTAVLTLFAVALWILALLARPLTSLRMTLVGSMAGVLVLVLAISPLRRFFALALPPAIVTFAAIGTFALANSVLEIGWRVAEWVGRRGAAKWEKLAGQR